MSFAGFNSGKFVKGRLQAALYTMRKKNRKRRDGGGPTPPGEWVAIQNIPGWTFEYLAPLGDNIVDNGSAWVATNHVVTGLDASIYLLALTVRAPTMPASFPLRVVFDSFQDSSDIPLVDKILGTNFAISGNIAHQFPNDDPPTSSYNGSPFEISLQPAPDGGQNALTRFYWTMSPPVADGAGPATTVSWEVRLEIQNSEGVWELIQDTDWEWGFDNGSMSNNGTTFNVFSAPYDMSVVMNISLQNVELETVNVRVTMLSYAVTPEVGQEGTYVSAPVMRLAGLNEPIELIGQTSWPQTEFPGTPWTQAVSAIHQAALPPDSYYFTIQGNDAAFQNSAEAGQKFSYNLRIEAQVD